MPDVALWSLPTSQMVVLWSANIPDGGAMITANIWKWDCGFVVIPHTCIYTAYWHCWQFNLKHYHTLYYMCTRNIVTVYTHMNHYKCFISKTLLNCEKIIIDYYCRGDHLCCYFISCLYIVYYNIHVVYIICSVKPMSLLVSHNLLSHLHLMW